MKRILIFILLLAFIIPVFAQETGNQDVWENYIFRIKYCQLSRYGAKVYYFSYTGYVKTLYVPQKYINKIFFIKVDHKAPYSFMHVVLKNKKIYRITVFLPNIMVQEYSTLDFSKKDIEIINNTSELKIEF